MCKHEKDAELHNYKDWLEEQLIDCRKQLSALRNEEQREQLYSFFMWLRENGEKHIGETIESAIDIYLKDK